ncbi:hypothetical protein BA195_02405 [Tenacibaculum soleae]|uniref:Tetratricopeptide repeat protein n=1 Tax=Tenacibaculum soleae TaxID=447689 RepID=A0A1B9Y193_9FLAO|nr:hypothetical protein [Tenacibaculum soleae]OCK43573.1 hypothetical protein BA195_02405 [Tenacibaculum soleae]
MFLSFFLIFYAFICYSQDSIPGVIAINEKNNIDFQENFFKALSQKAVFNHKKAIEYLNNCNEITPDDTAVLFELSKNYLKLGRNIEALEYIDLSLNIEEDNLWMLEHKVAILRRTADFKQAVTVQKQLAKKHPKKKRVLVYLHLQNRDVASAKKVLSELRNAKLLDSRLRRIEERLHNNVANKVKKAPKNIVNVDLRVIFEKEKTFANLKPLLNKLHINTHTDLLKYSEQGLTLFPAQPFIYLMNGKALNNNHQYKKALQSLQNGIDFVIDNTKIEAQFYFEMAKAYQKLNDTKKASFFKNKAEKTLK